MIRKMEKELIIGQMEMNIKENGLMMRKMEKELLNMQMEWCM